eukprot:10296977-Ditylum_brightwellii.AAC.1
MAVSTTNGVISGVKPSIEYEEFKTNTDVTDCPCTSKKRKLIHGDPQKEANLKQHHFTSAALEHPKLEADAIQGVPEKQPLHYLSEEHRTNACLEIYPSCSTISNIHPTWPVTHGNGILESSDCFHHFTEGCVSAQYEDKIDR